MPPSTSFSQAPQRPQSSAQIDHTASPSISTITSPSHIRNLNNAAQYQQRQIPSVPEPAWHTPTDEQFYVYDENGGRRPDTEFLKDHFFREGRLTEAQALFILEEATDILSREPNMLEIGGPVTICGDIHGQYYDLMKLFEVGGNLDDNSYLFLGDYVDRGCFGIECLLYLYALKLWYPNKVSLLRGNHECRHLTKYFTFERECMHKYSPDVYEAAVKSFCSLPVTALVDGRFFCVHGGISPELNTLDDLKNLDRFREPGSHGLLCDLLWADPIQNFGHEQDPQQNGVIHPPGTTFVHNEMRGCSFFYTYEAACKFLERNNLLSIIRGHEAQDAGYTMHRKQPNKKFPSVITIFSAPNYLDVYHNRGAVIKYANKNVTIRQYNWSQHPYWLPNFMDAFTWSLPFVGAKIIDMLLAVLAVCTEEELGPEGDVEATIEIADLGMTPAEIAQRREQIRAKIRTIGRMQRVFAILREETENAAELAAGANGLDAPQAGPRTLGVSGNQVRSYIKNFDDARKSDLLNERLPEFDPTGAENEVHAPSMRPGLSRSWTDLSTEQLIRQTLQEDPMAEQDDAVLGRRPAGFNRHGTT